MRFRKNASEQAGGDIPYVPAAAIAETGRELKRRGRRRLLLGAAGFIVILLINSRIFDNHGIVALMWGFRVVLMIGVALFVYGFVGTVYGNHVESRLERDPWVEWSLRLEPVRVAGRPVFYVVLLDNSDWPVTVVRVVRHGGARMLVDPGADEGGGSGDGDRLVWAAGHPARDMWVSPPGGAAPSHARRPLIRPMIHLYRRLSGIDQRDLRDDFDVLDIRD